MKNTVVQGPSVMAWILGAKERVGLSEIPSDQLALIGVGQETFPLSPAAKELMLIRFALKKEMEDQHDAVKNGDPEVHEALHRDLEHFGEPVIAILGHLTTLQLRLDAVGADIDLSNAEGFNTLPDERSLSSPTPTSSRRPSSTQPRVSGAGTRTTCSFREQRAPQGNLWRSFFLLYTHTNEIHALR